MLAAQNVSTGMHTKTVCKPSRDYRRFQCSQMNVAAWGQQLSCPVRFGFASVPDRASLQLTRARVAGAPSVSA